MFSTRHYEALAKFIKHLQMDVDNKMLLVSALSSMLSEDNPRFDIDKFKKACWR